MMDLKDLEDGKQIDADDEEISELKPPDNFDMLKFVRGRQFFQSHIFSCSMAMFFSLIIGMCIPELLQALVFTGESDSPKKAFKRYLKTFHHVALWHYGDVWKNGSAAQKSIIDVRAMHRIVRKRMERDILGSSPKVLSQYDMGIVQSAFTGLIIMYPEKVGLKCTVADLDDYVYFWYGIGHLMGIKRRYNICAHGLSQTLRFCKQIEDQILRVQMSNSKPSKDYLKMTNAVVTAFELGKRAIRIISIPVILKIFSTYYDHLPLTIGDYVRYIVWKLVFFTIYYCGWFKTNLNHKLEKAFNLNFNENEI